LVERKPQREPVEIPERSAEQIESSNLSLAMQLDAAGKTEQAKRRLQELQRDYPETSAATAAAARLQILNQRVLPERDFRADVVAVLSGDTIEVVLSNYDKFTVRLMGIIAPASGETLAAESKKRLSEKVLRKRVLIRWDGRENDSLLGEVWSQQRYINLEMIEEGMARYFRDHSESETLEKGERQARAAKRGLWAD
jgi:endonuclease YncB( thermonuclease family)